MQYRAASRLWKMAVSWAKSSLPAPVQGMIKSPASTGGGWSATGIAGVITAITAALAGAGEATRRGVKSMRRRQAEREVERDRELEAAHAEAEEAMQALDEVKSRHPQTVKAATDRKKRPNLRRAYVRRETADAVGSEA
jgi:Sec-independent protein translocase protein TatA